MGKEEEEQQQHPHSGVSYIAAVAAKNRHSDHQFIAVIER